MRKGDFRFDKVGEGVYSVHHLPLDKHIGSITKGYRGWDAHPNPAPFGGPNMTMVEAGQALLDKLDSEPKRTHQDFEED